MAGFNPVERPCNLMLEDGCDDLIDCRHLNPLLLSLELP